MKESQLKNSLSLIEFLRKDNKKLKMFSESFGNDNLEINKLNNYKLIEEIKKKNKEIQQLEKAYKEIVSIKTPDKELDYYKNQVLQLKEANSNNESTIKKLRATIEQYKNKEDKKSLNSINSPIINDRYKTNNAKNTQNNKDKRSLSVINSYDWRNSNLNKNFSKLFSEKEKKALFTLFESEEEYKNFNKKLNTIDNHYNATALKEIAETKRKYEKKGQSLFESYVNGVISQDVFSNKMAEINKIITDCDDRLNGTKFEEFNYDEINQKITKFLDEFKPDEDNIIKVIEENVAKAIYDPEKGSFVIILKFEEEIDIPSLNIKNFIKPEIGRRSEWDLDDIVYKIICDNPSIKGKGIYDEAKKVWEGFTFKGVERSIRSLRLKNMIKKEGKADLVDGYVKIDYVEDFDYHGMELNRKEKDIYKMLWYNPKMNYRELAEATNSHLDTAIKAVRKIRRLGGFEFSQFDKTYIPKGAFHSLYVEDKRIAAEIVKRIYRDIDANPNITPDEIKSKFNITLEQAQTYIERRRMKNENRNQ